MSAKPTAISSAQALPPATGAAQHRTLGGGLEVAAPHVLEEPGHGRDGGIGLARELVGVEDAVPGRAQDGRRAGTRLRGRDPRHRGADDPRRLDRDIAVDQPHRDHRLKEPDRFDVHLPERRLVLVEVEEAEGPPETAHQLEGEAGHLGDVGLGEVPPGRHEQPVDHEEIHDVVGNRLVDLLVRAAEAEEDVAHPGERLDTFHVGRLRQRVRRVVVRHDSHPNGGAPAGSSFRHGRPGEPRRTDPYTGAVADPMVPPGRPLGLGPRAVLVPVKSFSEAKHRLHEALSHVERRALARATADRVLDAARPLPVAVVCDDTEVAGWARSRGALVVWEPGRGLNGAVEAGVERLHSTGVVQVTVAHSDLPKAVDLPLVGDHEGITLVPDRYGNGTNVIALPADCGFQFSYGPGSFARHRAEAERIGFPACVLHRPDLAWDIDEPADVVPVQAAGPPDR